MKYEKWFETKQEYTDFLLTEEASMIYPRVSYIKEIDKVIFEDTPVFNMDFNDIDFVTIRNCYGE